VGEDVAVELTVEPGLWPVRIDPTQLDQILINLAANARDAMPRGGRLELAAANVTLAEADCHGHLGWRPGQYVCLTAHDEGEGMDAETLVHIFEPFFTRKEAGNGTGLGLATVYGAVAQCDGVIDVASAPGAGATFRILLPRAAGAAPQRQPALAAPVGASPVTALLVEDNSLVRATTSRMLRSLGVTVLEASGPAEAMALFQRRQAEISLLVSDVVMPEMQGPELARRLLAIQPGLRTVFISGYSAELALPPEPGLGRCRFLQKPFTRGDLAAQIQEVLEPETA
jgi:two-component system, cell cycle sensor histidine kinase and response regulator CckA